MFQKLKEENQKLLDKNLSLEKEIEDLKFQVSASALIISEHESKIEMLKAENKNLLKQINNTSKSSTEINNRLPLVSNVRGAGRKSRVDEITYQYDNFQNRSQKTVQNMTDKILLWISSPKKSKSFTGEFL